MIADKPSQRISFSRAVIEAERATYDLRRGLPVLLLSGAKTHLAINVESPHLHQLLPQLGNKLSVAITGARARVLGFSTRGKDAILQGNCEAWLEHVIALADPLQSPPNSILPLIEIGPAPAMAQAVLQLCKQAALLPAVVLAPLSAAAAKRWKDQGLASVTPEAVKALPAHLARLEKISEANVPLGEAASARVIAFRAPASPVEHLAVLVGRPEKMKAPLARLHSSCVTGDILGSLRCDCGEQLHGALRAIEADGGGILLYLNQEGRGIGIANKLRAYALQDRGLDTVEANQELGFDADERTFLVAAQMLKNLGIKSVRLLTNNPDKVRQLSRYGIKIEKRVPLAIKPSRHNARYLDTKAKKCGHLL